eukprot:SAG31_NODE_11_length_38734_cov_21.263854_14_plen_332_part_00
MLPVMVRLLRIYESLLVQLIARPHQEYADQLSPFYSKAPHAAVKELVRCFGSDLKQMVGNFNEMGPQAESLLQSVGLLIDAAAELLGQGDALSKLHKSVVMPFVPLVKQELKTQRVRFDKLCRQAIENENWSPVNQDSYISSSVYDIFVMIGQQVPVMLGSGLLLDDSIAKQFCQNIDSCVMAYSLHVREGIKDPPPLVPKPEKSKRRGSVEMVGRRAASLDGATTRVGSAVQQLEEDDDEEDDIGAEPELVDELVANCVRMNSLFFAADKVFDFSEQLMFAMDLDPEIQADDRPFGMLFNIIAKPLTLSLAVCLVLIYRLICGSWVPRDS